MMDLFIYLQTLPFLKYINKKTLVSIEKYYYFRSILCDAYSVFKLDKNVILLYDSNVYDSNNVNVISTNSNNNNIRLDIVIAVDIKHKPGYKNNDANNNTNTSSSSNNDNEPALYFIFNKKYHFLVDHTLITELAAPRNADTSLPVALYKFTNMALRFWIDPNDDFYRNNNNKGTMMTTNDCFNKLKDVISLMNKLLPKSIISHKILNVPRPYFDITKDDDSSSSSNNNHSSTDSIKLASPPSLPYLMAGKLDNWLSFLECSDDILSQSITINGISVAAISPIIQNNDNNDNGTKDSHIDEFMKANIVPSTNNKKRLYLYNQAAAHFCNSLLSRSEVSMLANNYNEIKEESENKINNYLEQLYGSINVHDSNDSNSQPMKKSKSGYDSSDNDNSQIKILKKHDSDNTTNSSHNASDILNNIKAEIEVIGKAAQDLSILRALPNVEI